MVHHASDRGRTVEERSADSRDGKSGALARIGDLGSAKIDLREFSLGDRSNVAAALVGDLSLEIWIDVRSQNHAQLDANCFCFDIVKLAHHRAHFEFCERRGRGRLRRANERFDLTGFQ